jgi:hypothetical protein
MEYSKLEEICQYDELQSRLRLLARLIARHHLNMKPSAGNSLQERSDIDAGEDNDGQGDEDLPGDSGN